MSPARITCLRWTTPMRLALGGIAGFLLVGGVLAGGDKSPQAASQAAAKKPFVHPGLLHTEADFVRMKAKVDAGAQPWVDGWKQLTESPLAQRGFKPRPGETPVRGQGVPGPNVALLRESAHAAYRCALRWKIGGDEAYAKKSIEIMNAWSAELKSVGGNNDRFLALGFHGFQFANAGEIMRGYPGWRGEDFKRFQDMMLKVFYEQNHEFLVKHNGAVITNYHANWDACNLASMMAIGVLCDRRDIYDEAVAYYKGGGGNGAIGHAVTHLHPGYLGQWQESGRDQAHTQCGFGLLACVCEMAWNQGDDLYGVDNNRLLAGAEYIARYNLDKDVPWQWYNRGEGLKGKLIKYDEVSPAVRGVLRPVYEMVYNHYVNRRGLDAPHTAQAAAKLRPEDGPSPRGHPSGFDHLGYGTLTFLRDPIATPTKPQALVAWKSGDTAILSWWGAAHAKSYNVKRAEKPGGPYSTVASKITEILTYADKNLPSGKRFYYVVTGVLASGQETAASNEVKVSTTPELHAHLTFDETGGTTAADASGNGRTGTLAAGAAWGPGQKANAVLLQKKGSHVSLPPGVVADLSDFTVTTWVYLDTVAEGSRVFDFGGKPGASMFLTPNGRGKVLFRVAMHHDFTSQTIQGTQPLPAGQWVHVAVTLSGPVCTLYINGVAVGIERDFRFPPVQLGATPKNWIGRSQFPADPPLDGKVGDFRIYHGALTAEEVVALTKGNARSARTSAVPASSK